jgi:hypothetical protein
MNTNKSDLRSRDSVVGIVTNIRTGRSGVRIPAEARDITLRQYVQTVSGSHPTSYWMVTRSSFPGVNRPWHEADHSPPFSGKVKNERDYTAIPPIRLHGACAFLQLLNICSNTQPQGNPCKYS